MNVGTTPRVPSQGEDAEAGGHSADTESNAILKISGLTISYGSSNAVENVDFTVDPGTVFGLVGPSGSGKTSILRCLGGYVKSHSGSITLGSQDITNVPVSQRNFGMVFQGYALFQNMTVWQNIAFGLKARHISKEMIKERVSEVIELADLEKLSSRFPSQLSGGQQQRVALARALAIRPRVLLFDEPMGALDAQLKDAVLEGIRRIQRQLAITTLYVTHDQREAFAICDKIAIVNEGHLAAVGGPRELYGRPPTRFAAAFVGTGTVLSLDVDELRRIGRVPALPGQETSAEIGAAIAEDAEVLAIFLRPEHVRCSTSDDGRGTGGLVEWVRYQGRDALVGVNIPGCQEVMITLVNGGISVGQRVWLSWRPEDAVVIEEAIDGRPVRAAHQTLVSILDGDAREITLARENDS